MRKAFYGSLCYQGIRGGAIYVDDKTVVYRNQTLTLPEEYKNITIPVAEIETVEKGILLLFPTVTLYLKNQKRYKFVIFNRSRFLKSLQYIQAITN